MKCLTAAACLIASVGVLLVNSTPADADTGVASAARETSASACINKYSGPNDVVNTYSGITLLCGGKSTGVLHINAGHPISTSGRDDVNVERCMNNIIYYGRSTPSSSSSNTGRIITRPGGGYAKIFWRTSGKNVVTMYTSDSNNWAACAAFPN